MNFPMNSMFVGKEFSAPRWSGNSLNTAKAVDWKDENGETQLKPFHGSN